MTWTARLMALNELLAFVTFQGNTLATTGTTVWRSSRSGLTKEEPSSCTVLLGLHQKSPTRAAWPNQELFIRLQVSVNYATTIPSQLIGMEKTFQVNSFQWTASTECFPNVSFMIFFKNYSQYLVHHLGFYEICFIDARNNFTYVFYFYYVFILVALGSSLVDSSYFCFNCFKPMFRYRQATKRSSQWHRGTF